MLLTSWFVFFFFFNDTATTEIYTLSLHDALPIAVHLAEFRAGRPGDTFRGWVDRKSTRLNSSHTVISYAVFCLKKKKEKMHIHLPVLDKTNDLDRVQPPEVE